MRLSYCILILRTLQSVPPKVAHSEFRYTSLIQDPPTHTPHPPNIYNADNINTLTQFRKQRLWRQPDCDHSLFFLLPDYILRTHQTLTTFKLISSQKLLIDPVRPAKAGILGDGGGGVQWVGPPPIMTRNKLKSGKMICVICFAILFGLIYYRWMASQCAVVPCVADWVLSGKVGSQSS